VGVGVRGDGEVALGDLLTDPRPRCPAEVHERDAAVPEVVRAERRDAGRGAGPSGRRPEAVAAEPRNTGRSAVRSSRGTSSSTASSTSGGTLTHRAPAVFDTAWEIRQRPRGSSSSPQARPSSSPRRIPVRQGRSEGAGTSAGAARGLPRRARRSAG
jgi:hypothetical protein